MVYGSGRAAHDQRVCIGNAVVDMDKLDGKRPSLNPVAVLDRLEGDPGNTGPPVFQLEPDQLDGQLVAVYRDTDVPAQPGQGADMVFVAMGQEDAFELMLVLHDIGKVGNDDVDAGHVVFRKSDAAVDDDHLVAVFVNGHVFADFAHAAQRDNLEQRRGRSGNGFYGAADGRTLACTRFAPG